MQYFWVMLFICLTGCSTVSTPPTEGSFPANKTNSALINTLQSWNMQGAIAVKTAQKGWNASFNWSQIYANYYLSIFGPLGSNRISLMGNNQCAILTTAEKTYEATNAETLLAEHLRWYIPVNSIQYWMQGLPAPGFANHIMYNTQGQLISIEQQGWHIQYLAYDKLNGVNLPMLIELHNAKILIRIAIHQWSF